MVSGEKFERHVYVDFFSQRFEQNNNAVTTKPVPDWCARANHLYENTSAIHDCDLRRCSHNRACRSEHYLVTAGTQFRNEYCGRRDWRTYAFFGADGLIGVAKAPFTRSPEPV